MQSCKAEQSGACFIVKMHWKLFFIIMNQLALTRRCRDIPNFDKVSPNKGNCLCFFTFSFSYQTLRSLWRWLVWSLLRLYLFLIYSFSYSQGRWAFTKRSRENTCTFIKYVLQEMSGNFGLRNILVHNVNVRSGKVIPVLTSLWVKRVRVLLGPARWNTKFYMVMDTRRYIRIVKR